LDDLRSLVDPNHEKLSVARQCELLGLARGSYYYQAAPESDDNLNLMRLIDAEYTKTPFYGSRRVVAWLAEYKNLYVNRKRIQRLMRLMRLEVIYPRPRLTQRDTEHRIYPYLLRGFVAHQVNQVWSTDITYIRLRSGFLYLTAVMDWHSRYVLAWELSNTLDASFCVSTLQRALLQGRPEIFNTDQGCQYTCKDFIKVLVDADIAISMDGRGRCLDNIFSERLWRTIKYEEVYLNDYATGEDAFRGLKRFFGFYNGERLHQSLGYRTPASIYFPAGDPCLN
jgi:putative transposase